MANILRIVILPGAGYSYCYYGILANTAVADSLTVTAGINFDIDLVSTYD